MAKQASNKKQSNNQRTAKAGRTMAATGVEPKKPAPNNAKPVRPKKKQDVQDIDRADSEGMAQPQGVVPKVKASAGGTRGRTNAEPACVSKVSAEKRKTMAKKAPASRASKRG